MKTADALQCPCSPAVEPVGPNENFRRRSGKGSVGAHTPGRFPSGGLAFHAVDGKHTGGQIGQTILACLHRAGQFFQGLLL